MTDLLDAVRDELRAREQRRDDLVAELAGVDRDVEQLTRISELATSLNGNGAVETPEPDQPSGGRAKPARQAATEKGRNGGEAPGRSPSGGAGSASSGQAKHAPPSTSKRATILAYVQEHGETKVADIAAAMGMSREAVGQHLKALRDNGDLQARGATSSRVYFSTAHGDQAAAGRGHAKGTGSSVPLPRLKQRVTNAIARDPGSLNEERLALALDVDREDIAVATGELLDAGDVLLQADGTYTIDRGGVPAPVNTTTEQTKAVTEVLARIDSAMHAKEIAYQATKAGTPVTEREASTILLALEQGGQAVRFNGMGGRLAWRAAE
jgi:predicted transcriptional regulator